MIAVFSTNETFLRNDNPAQKDAAPIWAKKQKYQGLKFFN